MISKIFSFNKKETKDLDFSSQMREILELSQFVDNIDNWIFSTLQQLHAIIPCEGVSIYIAQPKIKKFTVYRRRQKATIDISIDDLVGKTFLDQEHLCFLSPDPFIGKGLLQQILMPLVFGQKPFGVVEFYNIKQKTLTKKHKTMALEIARVLSLALHQHYTTHREYFLRYGSLTNTIIAPQTLKNAISLAHIEKKSVDEILIDKFGIQKELIRKALREYSHMPFYEFNRYHISVPSEVLKSLEPKYLKTNLWVPFRITDRTASIACVHPKSIEKRDDVRRLIKAKSYDFYITTTDQILKTIGFLWDIPDSSSNDDNKDGEEQKVEIEPIVEKTAPNGGIDELISFLDDDIDALENVEEGQREEEVNETSNIIVRIVHKMIEDACNLNASDIHVEPSRKQQKVFVRFRVDGACIKYAEFPYYKRRAIVSRIKVMANMDLANRLTPQDGKIQMSNYGMHGIELRVVTVPTVNNEEDAVMRILASGEPLSFEKLGILWREQEFKKMILAPYGIILVVGPTGSGKTTTLHSVLKELNTLEKKIWTLEDPVEITQEGLRQVQVNRKAGIHFNNTLRSFLRADPDIIMIGEIRDFETASIAVESSLTGHLVLSTLHTNSAPETITRFIDIGIDPINFSEALIGIVAQRLLRKLCPKCRIKEDLTEEEFDRLVTHYGKDYFYKQHDIKYAKDFFLYKANGCKFCSEKGYKGRLGIYELLISSTEIKQLITQKVPIDRIRDMAMNQGMMTLRQDGILKVLKHYTDLHQVLGSTS